MNNFVITLFIGTYWNKFPIHTLYTYISTLLLKAKHFQKQSLYNNSFLHVKIVMFCLCISACANCWFSITEYFIARNKEYQNISRVLDMLHEKIYL